MKKTSQHKHGLSVQFLPALQHPPSSPTHAHAHVTRACSKERARRRRAARAAGPGARPQCARCRALAPEQGGRAPEPSRNRGRLSFLCLSRPPPRPHNAAHLSCDGEDYALTLPSLKIALCGSFSTQRWRFRRPSRTRAARLRHSVVPRAGKIPLDHVQCVQRPVLGHLFTPAV